eukprot:TRINITY_DN2364_c0_g1_i1.p1 TRINITY_DN2364_c0_g1~~TRINITY_DN2364_c0_g1_i1.p1  ORF type:complete len:260 (-),score=61.62 TRINITY_DN2364_c0_g1_i1:84-758(-)
MLDDVENDVDYWTMTSASKSTNTSKYSKNTKQIQQKTAYPSSPQNIAVEEQDAIDDIQNNTEPKQRSPDSTPMYSLYRATAQPESGSAFQFYYIVDSVYIHATRQKLPKQTLLTPKGLFDWDNKITFKLSINEMGRILSYLSRPPPPGPNEKISFIHTTGNAYTGKKQSNLLLEPGKNVGSYRFSLSRYRKDDTNNVAIYFDVYEACVLIEFLRESIRRSCGFK